MNTNLLNLGRNKRGVRNSGFDSSWKQRSKYNRVQRAHPFKASADACRWQAITTPRGRKIMVALP